MLWDVELQMHERRVIIATMSAVLEVEADSQEEALQAAQAVIDSNEIEIADLDWDDDEEALIDAQDVDTPEVVEALFSVANINRDIPL